MKTLKVKADRSNDWTRDSIEQLKAILEKFGTHEGFEEYCDKNLIRIQVGDDKADVYFSPTTWSAIEEFMYICMGHLIEADELDKFPYYENIRNICSKRTGVEPGDFEDLQ